MSDLTNASVAEVITKLKVGTGLVADFVKGDETLIIEGEGGSYPSLAKLTKDTKEDLQNLRSIPFVTSGTDNVYFGMAVYSTSDEGADLACADSNTKKTVLGLVTEDIVLSGGNLGHALSTGKMTGTVQQWERATGMVGGLVPRRDYFLDIVKGQITPFPPSGPGQYLCPIGRALSNRDFLVRIDKTVAL